jgi:tetratricopeptide (TPR) repeat protein
MIMELRILLLALVASTTNVLAGGINREAFVMAEKVIQAWENGQTNDAERAFQQFAKTWEDVEKEGAYEKHLFIKAAECFLTFGKPTNSIVLLKQVFEKTGRSLPPEALYLFVKSTFETGDNQSAIKTLETRVDYLRELPDKKRQELAIIGAKASTAMGDIERAKKFLKEAVLIAPETQVGKEAKQELDRLYRESPPGK